PIAPEKTTPIESEATRENTTAQTPTAQTTIETAVEPTTAKPTATETVPVKPALPKVVPVESASQNTSSALPVLKAMDMIAGEFMNLVVEQVSLANTERFTALRPYARFRDEQGTGWKVNGQRVYFTSFEDLAMMKKEIIAALKPIPINPNDLVDTWMGAPYEAGQKLIVIADGELNGIPVEAGGIIDIWRDVPATEAVTWMSNAAYNSPTDKTVSLISELKLDGSDPSDEGATAEAVADAINRRYNEMVALVEQTTVALSKRIDKNQTTTVALESSVKTFKKSVNGRLADLESRPTYDEEQHVLTEDMQIFNDGVTVIYQKVLDNVYAGSRIQPLVDVQYGGSWVSTPLVDADVYTLNGQTVAFIGVDNENLALRVFIGGPAFANIE
ncbi:MAG: hypothetical protein ACPG8W_21990, partial [Candidatus Promineifilaceae bacterium]